MATKTWVGADNNWNTAGSWSPSGVPVATDDVYFVSGSNDVTTMPSSSVVLGSLNFGTKWTGSMLTNCIISATTVDYANKVGTVILEGVFTASDITIDAGKVLTYEHIDTLTQFGGTVTFANGDDGTTPTTTITLYKGVIKYQPTSTAVLTTLVAYGGYFDMRGCNSPSHTITNATIYSGSMIDERNGLANCIYTNPITSNGGVFMPDLGRAITVT